MWPNTVLRRVRLSRGGYTLIEMLVVVMIVLILIAATLPVAKKVMENSKPREASRQLNAHLAMSRAYASRNRRPFGLWMEYDAPVGEVDAASPAPTLRQVTRIYLAEVQPPYAGATTSARARIRETSAGSGVYIFEPVDLSTPPVPDAVEVAYLGSLVADGEQFLVKFDYKGEWYRCQRNGSQFQYLGPSSVAPPGYTSQTAAGKPFQILRQPRRVGNPLEMPAGTCIDIEYSGFGPDGTQFGAASQRLIVLFSPAGAVDGLYLDSLATPPLGTLHFLVGRVDKVEPPLGPSTHVSTFNMFDIEKSNLADPNNVWVSVGRLNGSITTSENVPDIEHGLSHATPWTTAGQLEYLEECRQVATGREQMGGQ